MFLFRREFANFFGVSSVGKECPECFWGELRQEKPQNFKCVVPKEGKLTFEKFDVIVVDPLDVGDVTVKDVVSEDVLINKISDSDVYSSGNAVNIKGNLHFNKKITLITGNNCYSQVNLNYF